MKKLHPPNKAQSHEFYGVYRRVRLGIYSRGDAFLAIRNVGSNTIGFGPNWVTLHRGPADEMRATAERLAKILDRYASAAGIPKPETATE